MRTKTYIRLFFLSLVVAISFLFFSYSRRSISSLDDKNSDCGSGKCEQKKAQTEFIIWESFTRNLLSVSQ